MNFKEALKRADSVCPPNHPSGKRVLFVSDSRKRLPAVDREHQLFLAEALGVLASQVRLLLAANRVLKAEVAKHRKPRSTPSTTK